jgi:hypothetical protein
MGIPSFLLNLAQLFIFHILVSNQFLPHAIDIAKFKKPLTQEAFIL